MSACASRCCGCRGWRAAARAWRDRLRPALIAFIKATLVQGDGRRGRIEEAAEALGQALDAPLPRAALSARLAGE